MDRPARRIPLLDVIRSRVRFLPMTLRGFYGALPTPIKIPLRMGRRAVMRMRAGVVGARSALPPTLIAVAEPAVIPKSYSEWQRGRLADRLAVATEPFALWNHLITVVIFGESGEAKALAATLASLRLQSYRNIELLVVGLPCDPLADASDFTGLRGLFFEPKLNALDILASDAADRLWRGSYLMFVRAGTEFAADAFSQLNIALNPPPGGASPELVICDHDRLSAAGELVEPSFVPGWDPDFILTFDYIGSAFLASRSLVMAQRGASRPGSLHQWLCGIARGVRQPTTRHVAEPLLHVPAGAPPLVPAVTTMALPWVHATEMPGMAIVIPNRNRPDLLKRCLGFLEFANGFRPELIIVDNDSDDSAVGALYDDLRVRYGARIVEMNQPFNYSRMVNVGVAASSADVVLLLNNDVEITAPGALEQVLAHALRPEVGVVGAVLAYPDGTVQHAGMLLQPGPTREHAVLAQHVLRGARRSGESYLHLLRTVRNYQCVTGALQATRREVFDQAGGFDEISLPIEYSDVDFCLKVRRAGWRVIALSLDGVIHAESATRGRESPPHVLRMRYASIATMARRWPEAIANDPFRNPRVEMGDIPQVRFPWSAETV